MLLISLKTCPYQYIIPQVKHGQMTCREHSPKQVL